ncbi:MAG: MraZ N-terminal domain-containing protein, partial [Kiloniellales bacterium]
MAVFIGTFENKIDRKGRVSVPAPFRLTLAGQSFQGIVAFRSYRAAAIEACGIDFMER